jgi:hypothetical protein
MTVKLLGLALLALVLIPVSAFALPSVRWMPAAVAATGIVITADVAFAQASASTTVTIPYGDWLAAAANSLIVILGALLAYGFRLLPAQVVGILQSLRADQLLTKAVEYGINAVAGAAKGKALDVNVGNDVVAEAVNYVIQQGPAWLINWLGGEDGIRRMVIARLPLAEDAALK